MGVSHGFTIYAYDVISGAPVVISSADQEGNPMLVSGNTAYIQTYDGYTITVNVKANGYYDAKWQGSSSNSTATVRMNLISTAPTPAPQICPYNSSLLAGDSRCVAPAPVTQVGQCEGTPDGVYTFGTCKNGQLVTGYVPPAEQYYVPPSSQPPATTPPPTTTPPSPTTCPSGQYLDISSKIPQCLPYPSSPADAGTPVYAPPVPSGSPTTSTGTEAIKYTCPNGSDIFVDPAMLRTGINPYDLCGAVNLPAPGQSLTPEQQKAQDAIDAAAAVAKANAGQPLTPTQQEAINKYFTTGQPETPKDNTGLYIVGAIAIGALALMFGGKK